MKPRHLFILGIILGLLVLGVFVKKIQRPPELATEEFTPLAFHVAVDKVSEVALRKGAGEEIVLFREGEGWRVKNLWNAPADSKKIHELLEEIRGAKGELRANDADLLGDFGLKDNEAFHLRITEEETGAASPLALSVGRKRPDPVSCFVVRKGSTRIYATEARILNRIGIFGALQTAELKADYWADLKILNVKPEVVEEFELRRIENGEEIKTLHFKRKKSEAGQTAWVYEGDEFPFAFDETKVEQFLSGASQVSALRVAEPGQDYGFESRPFLGIRFSLRDAAPVFLTFVKMTEDGIESYYLKSSASPVIFQISNSTLDQLDEDGRRLIRTNPLGMDRGVPVTLGIRAHAGERSFSLREGAGEEELSYYQALKDFPVIKILYGQARQDALGSPRNFTLTLTNEKQDEPLVLEFSGIPSGENEDYTAFRKGSDIPFVVSSRTFRQFFENTESVNV